MELRGKGIYIFLWFLHCRDSKKTWISRGRFLRGLLYEKWASFMFCHKLRIFRVSKRLKISSSFVLIIAYTINTLDTQWRGVDQHFTRNVYPSGGFFPRQKQQAPMWNQKVFTRNISETCKELTEKPLFKVGMEYQS